MWPKLATVALAVVFAFQPSGRRKGRKKAHSLVWRVLPGRCIHHLHLHPIIQDLVTWLYPYTKEAGEYCLFQETICYAKMGKQIKGERIFIAQSAPFVIERRMRTFTIESLLPCLWHRTNTRPTPTGVTAPLSIRVSSTLLSYKVQCVVTSCFIHLPLPTNTPRSRAAPRSSSLPLEPLT